MIKTLQIFFMSGQRGVRFRASRNLLLVLADCMKREPGW